jgi:uncharacterized protein HemX
MDNFNPNQMPPIQNQPEKKSMGPLVAVIVILALIIIGGLYFLKQRSNQQVYVPVEQEQKDAVTESLNQQGSSDELNSIESDLNTTNVDSLDQGATVIEAEL